MYSVAEFCNDRSVAEVAVAWFYTAGSVLWPKKHRQRSILLENNQRPPDGTKAYAVKVLKRGLTLEKARKVARRAQNTDNLSSSEPHQLGRSKRIRRIRKLTSDADDEDSPNQPKEPTGWPAPPPILQRIRKLTSDADDEDSPNQPKEPTGWPAPPPILHSDPHAQLILTTDASNSAVGAVLHQQGNNQSRPLAFFSQKLQPAKTRYSTFFRELLTICLAIRHFRHLLEGRDFSVHTDHKPLTYALKAKPDGYSPRKVRHLDYISQFTADIRYVRGSDNVVADALSRPDINTFTTDFDLAKLADLQSGDKSIDDLRSTTALQLRDAPLPASPVGPLPPSRGLTHILTAVDRFTRWPIAVPISDTSAANIAMVFWTYWISFFGVPATLTTDRGSHFQSSLFREFTKLLGCVHLTTTAYHLGANDLVERLHGQLKSALMSQTESASWSDSLPLVLLGIRSSVKEDIQCTAAELVYGTPLRLPG
nr:unnamed protein product [Spirometra erinaceieuropaei]